MSSPDTIGKAPPEQAPQRPAGPETPACAPLSPEAGIRQKILLLLDQAGIAGLAKLPKACANRIAMLAAVERDPFALLLATDELQDDKEIVLTAVKQNGLLLRVASERLQNNMEVVETAVKQNPGAVGYMGRELRATKPGALLYVQHNNSYWGGMPANFTDDKDVVLVAVGKYGGHLEYCSERLRDDEDVVFTAVERSVGGYKYASDRLKASRRIIIEVLINAINPMSFSVDKTLIDDIKSHCPADLLPLFMLIGGTYDKCDFDGLPASIKDDELIISAAIKHGLKKFYEHASPRLKMRRDIALDAIEQDANTFECVDEGFKKDRVFLTEAAKRNFRLLSITDFMDTYRAACA